MKFKNIFKNHNNNCFIIIVFLLLLTSVQAQNPQAIKCGNDVFSEQLSTLIIAHENQTRTTLSCNKKLNEIALLKAQMIVKEQDIWHNAGHLTPNQLLRHHGFKLPRTYPVFGNQVEALAGGEESTEEVFNDFLLSEPHKKLLLGEDDFFREQDQIGVAHIEDKSTEHEHYWVVIIADEKNHTVKQEPIIEVEPPVVAKKKRRGREIKEKMYRNKVRSTRIF